MHPRHAGCCGPGFRAIGLILLMSMVLMMNVLAQFAVGYPSYGSYPYAYPGASPYTPMMPYMSSPYPPPPPPPMPMAPPPPPTFYSPPMAPTVPYGVPVSYSCTIGAPPAWTAPNSPPVGGIAPAAAGSSSAKANGLLSDATAQTGRSPAGGGGGRATFNASTPPLAGGNRRTHHFPSQPPAAAPEPPPPQQPVATTSSRANRDVSLDDVDELMGDSSLSRSIRRERKKPQPTRHTAAIEEEHTTHMNPFLSPLHPANAGRVNGNPPAPKSEPATTSETHSVTMVHDPVAYPLVQHHVVHHPPPAMWNPYPMRPVMPLYQQPLYQAPSIMSSSTSLGIPPIAPMASPSMIRLTPLTSNGWQNGNPLASSMLPVVSTNGISVPMNSIQTYSSVIPYDSPRDIKTITGAISPFNASSPIFIAN